MNEIKLTNQDGKKERVLIPSNWNELTLEQFIKIENLDWSNVLEVFSVVTGLDISIPENSKDKNLERTIWESIAFLNEVPDWSRLKAPKVFEIEGELYTVPTDFEKMMVGQKILIGQTVKDIEDLIVKIPRVLAIIFMPQYTKDGKFDSSKIDELGGKILKSLGVESYAIAKGFFLRSNHLRKYGLNGLKKYQQSKTKTKRISRNWLTLEGSTSLQTSNK